MHSITLVPTEFGTYRTLCMCVWMYIVGPPAHPACIGNLGFGRITPLLLPRMVRLPPCSADPRALLQWVPMLRSCPLSVTLHKGSQCFCGWLRNKCKKWAHRLLPKRSALLCHHHWRESRLTKHTDGTELGRAAGMEEDRFSFEHVLFQIWHTEWKKQCIPVRANARYFM